MKIRSVGPELFHADRQMTDIMNLIVAFRNLRTCLKFYILPTLYLHVFFMYLRKNIEFTTLND